MGAMGADGADDDRTYPAMIGRWVTVARASGGFVGGGGIAVGLSTFLVALGLHGRSYDDGGVPAAIAFAGAAAAQLAVIVLLTATLSLYPSGRTARWWRVLMAAAAVLMLFFAVLPALVARYSWLAVLLLAVLTIVYDLAVAAYLAVVQPWAYLTDP